jgi:hypothetical protein
VDVPNWRLVLNWIHLSFVAGASTAHPNNLHVLDSAVSLSKNLFLSQSNWWLLPIFISRSVNLPALRQLSPSFNSYPGTIDEENASKSYFRVMAEIVKMAKEQEVSSVMYKELIFPNLAGIIHAILEKLTHPESSIRVLALDTLALLEMSISHLASESSFPVSKAESAIDEASHLQLQRARAMMLADNSSLHIIAQQHMSARLASQYPAQASRFVLTAIQSWMHLNCRKFGRWQAELQQPYSPMQASSLIRWIMPWFQHVSLQVSSLPLRVTLIESLFSLSFNPLASLGVPEVSDMWRHLTLDEEGSNLASSLGFILQSLLFTKYSKASESESNYPFVLNSLQDFIAASHEVVCHLSRSQPEKVAEILTKFLDEKKLEWIGIHSMQSNSSATLSPTSRQMLMAVSLLSTCIKSSEFIFAPSFCAHGTSALIKSRASLSLSLSIILQIGLNGVTHPNCQIQTECSSLLLCVANSLALLSVRCATFSSFGADCQNVLASIEPLLSNPDSSSTSALKLVDSFVQLLKIVSSSLEPNSTLAVLSRSPSVASRRPHSPSKRSLL